MCMLEWAESGGGRDLWELVLVDEELVDQGYFACRAWKHERNDDRDCVDALRPVIVFEGVTAVGEVTW